MTDDQRKQAQTDDDSKKTHHVDRIDETEDVNVVRICCDLSAVRGMISPRGGSKRAKHTHASFRHVQSLVHKQQIDTKPVQGSVNVDDIGTKYVSTRVLDSTVRSLVAGTAAERCATSSAVLAIKSESWSADN